ncbi:hypothetical protein BKA66DRAFT_68979 [Pyrenochaeta sp. MPI-SDFR-AT-0127]|nr:hypothetical protein BKA66DRAFT_68979 [Pyrenochaeta sp. MPI-SDFR-AT-0127]
MAVTTTRCRATSRSYAPASNRAIARPWRLTHRKNLTPDLSETHGSVPEHLPNGERSFVGPRS